MKRLLLLALPLGLLALAAALASADSLWCPEAESMFADRRAHRVGDIITVLIAEASSSKHQASTDTKKDWDEEGGPGTGLIRLFPDFSMSSKRSTSGSGSSVRTTSVVDRISAKVTELLPNGLLRIQGEREVDLQPDKVKLTITGQVRPEDIGADNVVSSTHVAELKINSSGKGPIADTHRRGLLSRLLAWIW